jgi:hypothetical protein
MQLSIEFRLTPPFTRPNDFPSLGYILAVSPMEHLWIGGGYELTQDYDAVLWNSEREGHKPLVFSGARLGAWYRAGADRCGWTFAAGPLLTYANKWITYGSAEPVGITSDTYVLDFGIDLSLGYIWQTVRFEPFFTPAWSHGRIASPGANRVDNYDAFTWRTGLSLAVVFGSSAAASGPAPEERFE